MVLRESFDSEQRGGRFDHLRMIDVSSETALQETLSEAERALKSGITDQAELGALRTAADTVVRGSQGQLQRLREAGNISAEQRATMAHLESLAENAAELSNEIVGQMEEYERGLNEDETRIIVPQEFSAEKKALSSQESLQEILLTAEDIRDEILKEVKNGGVDGSMTRRFRDELHYKWLDLALRGGTPEQQKLWTLMQEINDAIDEGHSNQLREEINRVAPMADRNSPMRQERRSPDVRAERPKSLWRRLFSGK